MVKRARRALPQNSGLRFAPKNEEQEELICSLANNYLTICRSKQFGSGKTFCSIGYSCQLLKRGDVQQVIFCRDSSAVSDRLGFLPGSRGQKISETVKFAAQYFRLFLGDHFQQFYSQIHYRDVADLAGETFTDAFMILDEASDCSLEDVAMFVSRAGHGTRCAVLGTDRQIKKTNSCFEQLFVRLSGVPGVGLCELKTIERNGWLGRVLTALDA